MDPHIYKVCWVLPVPVYGLAYIWESNYKTGHTVVRDVPVKLYGSSGDRGKSPKGRVLSRWAGLADSALSFVHSRLHISDTQWQGWSDSKQPKRQFQHIPHAAFKPFSDFLLPKCSNFKVPSRANHSLFCYSRDFFSFRGRVDVSELWI